MGFGEMRLTAASTAGAPADVPASTMTTPSSPTCTAMFAPAPAIRKKEGRTSRISRLLDGAAAACGAAAPCLRENAAAQIATTEAIRRQWRQFGNMIFIVCGTASRRLTHNLGGQQQCSHNDEDYQQLADLDARSVSD